MIKKTALICISIFAALAAMPGFSSAQFVLPSPPQPAPKQEEAASAIPDDIRLALMIRSVVVALNQANTTGNYSVLRELGTANFQMTNSPAHLAEIFAALRARKIDLSPVMVFNPKLTTAPSLQDGQVLRLTGFFPTSPEQVQFDLAYQHSGDQWQLAGIAINVAPPSDDAQASASPAGQLAQMTAEPGPAPEAKPGEGKPIHIDLSQPAAPQPKPAAPKKPTSKKQKPPAAPAHKTATAEGAKASPAPEAAAPAPAPQPQAAPAANNPEFGSSWNPFGH